MTNSELSEAITNKIMECPILSAQALYNLILFMLENQPKEDKKEPHYDES